MNYTKMLLDGKGQLQYYKRFGIVIYSKVLQSGFIKSAKAR